MTVVYGYNTIEQRKLLWDNLTEVAQGITKPLLIDGDFNSILYTQDRLHGCIVNSEEIRDNANCIQALGLTELAWEGDYYTWSNKKFVSDRVFGNYEWMLTWDYISTAYGMSYFFDHSTMTLKLTLQQRSGKSPFKFFNVWVEHEDFLNIVQ